METKVIQMDEVAICETLLIAKRCRVKLTYEAVDNVVCDIMGYAEEFRRSAGTYPEGCDEFDNLIADSNKMIDAAATICELFHYCPKKYRR